MVGTTWRKLQLEALAILAVFISLIVLQACGGHDPAKTTGGGSTSSITVTVSPSSVALYPGATQQFTATVSGTTNTGVNWLVSCKAGGTACGAISTTGLYSPPIQPPSPNSITVTATSVASSSAQATASVTINGTKTTSSATVSASPTSFSFGNVIVGVTSTKALTLSNSGTSTVSVYPPTTSGDFTISGATYPLSIGAASSVTVNVVFNPTVYASESATISFASNAINSPTNISVSGTGISPPPPQIAVTPTSIDFGTLAVGTTSNVPMSISNIGGQTLSLSGIPLSGSTAFLTPCCGAALPLNLNAGQTLFVTVAFVPTTTGTFSGSLNFVSNASNIAPTVLLSASATSPTYTVSVNPTTVSFSSVLVGSTAGQLVTLANTGSASVTISSISPSQSIFGTTGISLPLTLAPGTSTIVSVNVTPTTTGSFNGQVSFVSNATNSPATVTISGNAVAPVQHSASLTWTASTSAAAGYRIYRSTTSGSGYVLLNSVLVPGTTYTDSTVQSGKTYYYAVTAIDSSGNESTQSNQVGVVIPYP